MDANLVIVTLEALMTTLAIFIADSVSAVLTRLGALALNRSKAILLEASTFASMKPNTVASLIVDSS